jgi:nitroreductase
MITNNAVLDAIFSRYTCRAYKDDLPGKETLETIARAALASPSAMNRQPWRIIMVTNKALLEEMDAAGLAQMDPVVRERIASRGGKLFYNAPAMALITIEEGTALDCGIVSENIALAARGLGLDSCICALAGGAFKSAHGDAFRQRLGILPGYEFGIAVLLGFAAQPVKAHTTEEGKISFVS